MSNIAAPTARRRGPWRWFVALLATVLLVVSGSGLVAFAQSGAGTSRGPAFVPADAAIYVVGRLDMPAGQDEALAQFLTAFPGFADAGSFDMKAGDLMDGLIGQLTDGALTYSGELENFLTGEVGLAVMDLAGAAMTGEDPPVLAGLAISDAAAAQSFVELLTAGATGADVETYGSASIISDSGMAIAVDDEWILIAQSADLIRAGIDVLDGSTPSLADDQQFATAFARVPAGHLAAAYMNLQSFTGLIELAGMAAAGQMGTGLPTEDLLAQLPTDMTAYLAAADDRMTFEAFITPADATMEFPVGESDLATVFPADTQLYVETRDLGTLLQTTLTGLLESLDEEQVAGMAPIQSMLGEPLPSFFDFVSDASVGAALNSDGVWLGMAAEVNDAATADTRVERLLSIVRLLGSQVEGVTIEAVTVGDASVNVISLPIDEAGGELPIPIGDTISLTVADDMLLLGTGDFVIDALASDPVDSLALSPGYVDALGTDTANAGVLYANISGLLTQIEPMLGFMVPEWSDIAPYAMGLDRLIAVGNVDEVISSRITVIVNQ